MKASYIWTAVAVAVAAIVGLFLFRRGQTTPAAAAAAVQNGAPGYPVAPVAARPVAPAASGTVQDIAAIGTTAASLLDALGASSWFSGNPDTVTAY
jgi:hypothetical protein